METSDGESFKLGTCYPDRKQKHFWIEEAYFGKSKYGLVNCVVWHESPHKETIYLVSNVEFVGDIMSFYKKRFSIETIFGDMKSRGFNLQKVRVKNPDMLNNLLIIIALAFLLVFTLGLNTKHIKLSHIVRKDRVDSYSVFQIGYKIALHILENKTDIFYKLNSIFDPYFCVRF